MTLGEVFLSNAGWLFFTAWSVIVGVVTVKAFGRDLLPTKARLDSQPGSRPAQPATSARARVR